MIVFLFSLVWRRSRVVCSWAGVRALCVVFIVVVVFAVGERVVRAEASVQWPEASALGTAAQNFRLQSLPASDGVDGQSLYWKAYLGFVPLGVMRLTYVIDVDADGDGRYSALLEAQVGTVNWGGYVRTEGAVLGGVLVPYSLYSTGRYLSREPKETFLFFDDAGPTEWRLPHRDIDQSRVDLEDFDTVRSTRDFLTAIVHSLAEARRTGSCLDRSYLIFDGRKRFIYTALAAEPERARARKDSLYEDKVSASICVYRSMWRSGLASDSMNEVDKINTPRFYFERIVDSEGSFVPIYGRDRLIKFYLTEYLHGASARDYLSDFDRRHH